MYDIMIVGGGPAGLTAAIYGLRAGKSVLVIEKNGFGGQIAYSPKVENIPGTQMISGAEFADHLTEQVMALGADVVTAAFQPGYFGDGTMLGRAVIMCLCDYVLAYSLLGLGGCFRNTVKNKGLSLMCGSLVATGARYCAHIVSGYVLFAGWAEWFFTQEGFPAWGAALLESLSPQVLGFVYSVVYNGMYMIPEMVITAAAALLIARVPGIVTK